MTTTDRINESIDILPSSSKLKTSYQNLLRETQTLFPKIDQKLLLDILRFEDMNKDWEGSVMLKVVPRRN